MRALPALVSLSFVFWIAHKNGFRLLVLVFADNRQAVAKMPTYTTGSRRM